MINILHIITDTNIGGAGRLLIQYLKCFDRENFSVTVAVPKDSLLTPLIAELGCATIETEHCADRSHERGGITEYRRIIKKLRPDIVHTHSSLDGRAAALLCGVRSRIMTRHCAFEPSRVLTSFPGRQINGIVNGILSTRIVASASSAADALIKTGISPKKITLIVNGVEPLRGLDERARAEFRRSLGIGEDDFVCLISARLEEYKGHSYLLDTAREVCDAAPRPVKFIFMGEGSCRASLEEKTKKLGLEDNIIFTGFVDDVAPYCNITDVNINSSWGSETTPLSISEGMSLSKAAVVTSCGGNTYMVEDGVNGFTVGMKDAHAMAEAILKLCRDGELLRRLDEGAKRIYNERFTSEIMTQKLEALYYDEYKRTRKAR